MGRNKEVALQTSANLSIQPGKCLMPLLRWACNIPAAAPMMLTRLVNFPNNLKVKVLISVFSAVSP